MEADIYYYFKNLEKKEINMDSKILNFSLKNFKENYILTNSLEFLQKSREN